MRLLIKGGRLIDPSQGIDQKLDLLVENGKISIVGTIDPSQHRQKGDRLRVLDATGKIVVPGLVDMHTHLREPGYEYKETIKSGTEAAARGGFTSVACMANTDPVNDNGSVTEYILQKARQEAAVNVYPIGAVTKGLRGEALSEIGELKEAGAVALSDDGRTVVNSQLLRKAMEYAKGFGLPIISHCEDPYLSSGGVMSEGLVSTELGLGPIPPASEEVIVARDIILAQWTGCALHIAHVSTAGSVRMIREAKARGVNVTAEVSPHHLILTDQAVRSFDTNTKVNPPLRSEADVEALQEALSDGTIDAIASDHAPHSLAEKELEYDLAAPGIAGLETTLSLALMLLKNGRVELSTLIRALSTNPARILGISKGTLAPRADADITILDLQKEVTVDADRFRSKGRNTPFNGWRLQGDVEMTIVGGSIVYSSKGL